MNHKCEENFNGDGFWGQLKTAEASEKEILFSVNDYDSDGDKIEKGIYRHFGNTRIKVSDTSEDFDKFILNLTGMAKEIKDNYLLR